MLVGLECWQWSFITWNISTLREFPAESCPPGTAFDPCRKVPFERSCETKDEIDEHEHHHSERSEGCFVNCKDTEVVVDGLCKPVEVCSMCYDAEREQYVNVSCLGYGWDKCPGTISLTSFCCVKASSTWVSPSNPCSVCTCDSNTLEIICSNRSCAHLPEPPVCGECEGLRVKPGSDPCCPEQICGTCCLQLIATDLMKAHCFGACLKSVRFSLMLIKSKSIHPKIDKSPVNSGSQPDVYVWPTDVHCVGN